MATSRIWLNEMNHKRVFVEPDLKARCWRWGKSRSHLGHFRADPPEAGDEHTWEEIPLWKELPECDSLWHYPAGRAGDPKSPFADPKDAEGREHHGRHAHAVDACPYCGMTAKEDAARRRRDKHPLLLGETGKAGV